jgi:hypothetical protein
MPAGTLKTTVPAGGSCGLCSFGRNAHSAEMYTAFHSVEVIHREACEGRSGISSFNPNFLDHTLSGQCGAGNTVRGLVFSAPTL